MLLALFGVTVLYQDHAGRSAILGHRRLGEAVVLRVVFQLDQF